MKNLLMITKEDFVNLYKNPMWVFYATAFPIILVAIMGYLTRNAYGSLITSYDYYGISLMIYALINSGMTSANAFMEERIRKPNMRIVYAPGNISNIYLSKILSSFLFSFPLHLLDLVVIRLLFQVRLRQIGLLILLFGATELCFITLGVMICCLVKSEMIGNQIQGIAVNILAILGGALFSLDGYGAVARTISMLSPVKWIVTSSFQLIYDGSSALFGRTMLIIIICIIVMILICGISFHKEDCICLQS